MRNATVTVMTAIAVRWQQPDGARVELTDSGPPIGDELHAARREYKLCCHTYDDGGGNEHDWRKA